MKPRIRLSPMSSRTCRLWECGVVGAGRTMDEAYASWERQVRLRPDLMEFPK